MKTKHLRLCILSLALSLLSLISPIRASMDMAGLPTLPTGRALAGSIYPFDNPTMFIENVGQFPDGVRFRTWGGPGTMWLTEDSIRITFVERLPVGMLGSFNLEPERTTLRGVNLKLSFLGANPHPRLEPFNPLDTTISYISNDPYQPYKSVPVWGGARYVELYPGIDLEVSGTGGQWRPRIVAQPGANLTDVRLRVEGADDLSLQPVSYYEGWTRSSWLRGGYEYEATLPSGRKTLTAIGGPLSAGDMEASGLIYSTFLGGTSEDRASALAVDDSGAIYVAGSTSSSDFPTTPGAFDTNYDGHDVFVVKLTPDGGSLAYATFLGGSKGDWPFALAVDGSGAAYLAGRTESADFPTTASAFDTSPPGGFDCLGSPCPDAFVVKLMPDGGSLAYATFLGGSNIEGPSALAVDSSGAAYVAGVTFSHDFPTTAGAFDTSYNGNWDAFVVKLTPDGDSLAYATFLGGSNWDEPKALAVDGDGAAYVAGTNQFANFPTTAGAFDTSHNGHEDAFVVKLTPDGDNLAYATFLGGSRNDWAETLAVDGFGAAYVAGKTSSSDFPTTASAFDTSYNDDLYGGDAFVVKLTPDGGSLAYATFLGGSNIEGASALAVDGSGAAYVAGVTFSHDFPTTAGAFDSSCGTDPDENCNYSEISSRYYADAFVTKLNATGSELAYSTFLGGGSDDSGNALAVDDSGTVYVAGDTRSEENFPTTADAFDTSYNGDPYGGDVFIAKLAVGEPGPTLTPIPTPTLTPTRTPTRTIAPIPQVTATKVPGEAAAQPTRVAVAATETPAPAGKGVPPCSLPLVGGIAAVVLMRAIRFLVTRQP